MTLRIAGMVRPLIFDRLIPWSPVPTTSRRRHSTAVRLVVNPVANRGRPHATGGAWGRRTRSLRTGGRSAFHYGGGIMERASMRKTIPRPVRGGKGNTENRHSSSDSSYVNGLD